MEYQHSTHHHSGHPHAELIDTIIACALACEDCVVACLEEKDVTMMARCIELDRDCADICFLAARLLRRDSEIAHPYLKVCAEICRLCGDECSMHQHKHCQECARACRRCEEACMQHHAEAQLQ